MMHHAKRRPAQTRPPALPTLWQIFYHSPLLLDESAHFLAAKSGPFERLGFLLAFLGLRNRLQTLPVALGVRCSRGITGPRLIDGTTLPSSRPR